VRVIDENQRLAVPADLFHPAGNGRKGSDAPADVVRMQAERLCGGGGGEDVVEIEAPGQGRTRIEPPRPGDDRCLDAPRRETERFRPDVAGRLDPVGQGRFGEAGGELAAPGIVGIDDRPRGKAFRALRQDVREKTFLRAEVIVHGAVVVQVVLGQVREDPDRELAVVDPGEVDRVRGNLGDDVGRSLAEHLGEDPLKIKRFGGGVRSGQSLAAVPVIDGADDAGLETCGGEDRLKEVGHRGLSVRAGHGDQGQAGGGVAVEIPPCDSQTPAAVPDPDGEEAGTGSKGPIMEDESRSPGDSFGDEVVAVDVEAPHGDEKAPRGALSGIVTDRTNLTFRAALSFEDFDVFQDGADIHAHLAHQGRSRRKSRDRRQERSTGEDFSDRPQESCPVKERRKGAIPRAAVGEDRGIGRGRLGIFVSPPG